MHGQGDTSTLTYERLLGAGGIGTGHFFALEGNTSLGRSESRAARLLDARDFCKLHIVIHYVAKLLTDLRPSPFKVFPIGKVGDDSAGRLARHDMEVVGIDTRFVVIDPHAPTLMSICYQYPDGTGGNITSSNSAASKLSIDELNDAGLMLGASGGRCIVLAVPEAPLDVRNTLILRGRAAGAFCVASFTDGEIRDIRHSDILMPLDLLALNKSEASLLIECELDMDKPQTFIQECLAFISKTSPGLRMVVSAGDHGAFGFWHGAWNYCPALQVDVESTAGAGDALLGAVIAAIASGIPFINETPLEIADLRCVTTALEFGVALASYKVTSPHSIHPDASFENLSRFLRESGISFSPAFVLAFAPLSSPLAQLDPGSPVTLPGELGSGGEPAEKTDTSLGAST